MIDFNPSTIVATFTDVSDETIDSFFRKNDLFGTRTSVVLKRYAIEVPYGQEKQNIKLLEESDLISEVHGCVEGRKKFRKKRIYER